MFALVSGSTVIEIAAEAFPVNPAFVWTTSLEGVTPAPEVGWIAAESSGAWTFTASSAASKPLAGQQAVTALLASLAPSAEAALLT